MIWKLCQNFSLIVLCRCPTEKRARARLRVSWRLPARPRRTRSWSRCSRYTKSIIRGKKAKYLKYKKNKKIYMIYASCILIFDRNLLEMIIKEESSNFSQKKITLLSLLSHLARIPYFFSSRVKHSEDLLIWINIKISTDQKYISIIISFTGRWRGSIDRTHTG